MYIQENLTTSSIEVPEISWLLPKELEDKFFRFGAFSKLVFNDDKTAIIDIVEDTEKKANHERRMQEMLEEEQRVFEEKKRNEEARALKQKGMEVLSNILFNIYVPDLTTEEIILCRGLASEWTPKKYKVDEVCVDNGIPFRCIKEHTGTKGNTKTTSNHELWRPYHGTSIETALPYMNPANESEIYKTGEYIIWTDGSIMKAVKDTNFSPDDEPEAWVKEDNENV